MDKKQEAVKVFGFDPATVGLRHRGWWIISEPDDDDLQVGAKSGDLCVKARDGASNPIDVSAFKVGDCIGSLEDGFDCTYRYYWYRRLVREGEK